MISRARPTTIVIAEQIYATGFVRWAFGERLGLHRLIHRNQASADAFTVAIVSFSASQTDSDFVWTWRPLLHHLNQGLHLLTHHRRLQLLHQCWIQIIKKSCEFGSKVVATDSFVAEAEPKLEISCCSGLGLLCWSIWYYLVCCCVPRWPSYSWSRGYQCNCCDQPL